jgi:hypothetical protein
MTPRIFVDFHNCDPQGRVRLNTVGSIQDLASSGIRLESGTPLVLCDYEEFEIEGTAEYSAEEGIWVAVFDWDRRNA